MTIIEAESAVDLSPDVAHDLHRQAISQARRSAIVRTAIVVVTVPLFILMALENAMWGLMLSGVMFPVLLGAGVSVRAYRRLRRLHPLDSFRQDVEEHARRERFRTEHEIRIAGARPWMSYALAASLVVLFLVEIPAGSIARVVERAGFVKASVLRGEWWRLVTAACVHANAMHLLGNVGALLGLGTLMEAYDRRMRVPVVYLAAAIGGSLASLLLTDKSGLGASGGIMGLAGYLLVRARDRKLPGPVAERLLVLLGSTAFIGLVGYQFIGNAAHAGGALAGAALAWVTRGEDAQESDPIGDFVGWASVAVLALASVGTLVRLVG